MRPDGRPNGPGRPARARLFFALWPAAGIADTLGRLAAENARQFGGRPTRPETLHLTLAFLGDVALDRLPRLHAVAEEVRVAAFGLRLDRLGFWRHNRILWAGGNAVAGLQDLVGQLNNRLGGLGLAGAEGGRPFVPHVTLVRKPVTDLPILPAIEPIDWDCREFVLVRSRLSSQGPAYETLGRWPLGQAKS